MPVLSREIAIYFHSPRILLTLSLFSGTPSLKFSKSQSSCFLLLYIFLYAVGVIPTIFRKTSEK